MSDAEPLLVIKNYTATQTAKIRGEVLKDVTIRQSFLTEYEEIAGTQNFLKGVQNYPDLAGMKVNLYKCFLPQAWIYVNPDGTFSSFILKESMMIRRGSFAFQVISKA